MQLSGVRYRVGACLVLVGIAVVSEPEAQELLVDVLRLLPCSMALLVAACQPVAARVWRVDLHNAHEGYQSRGLMSVPLLSPIYLQYYERVD